MNNVTNISKILCAAYFNIMSSNQSQKNELVITNLKWSSETELSLPHDDIKQKTH